MTGSFCIDCCFFLPFLSTAIEIGFTRERITHLEQFARFDEIINKSRVSEQTFQLQFEISTVISSSGVQRATQNEDFAVGSDTKLVYNQLAPSDSNLPFGYRIFHDIRPENTEVFQVSVTPDPRSASNPSFDCNKDNGCHWRLEIRIEDDDGELSLYQSHEFIICHLNQLSLLPKYQYIVLIILLQLSYLKLFSCYSCRGRVCGDTC